MRKARILVVEDETSLLEAIAYNLVKEGYEALTAADGLVALELARTQSPDIILLDIMLPGLDGLELCRILRKDMTVPILMLTARADEVDKLVGLEMGADDYMTKPFSMRELLARIKAMLRRMEMMQPQSIKEENILQAADLTIDFSRHEVSVNGKAVSLKPKEFDLLAFLVKHRGQVFSRDHLLEKVWGYDYAGDTRTVDVHIRWLRERTETDPAHPNHLLTVRGVGYKFEG
ncbi:MAG: response regulator transcription factor [Dehalococcoidia bacterium]|nr:response regulator transcription factor [Dehalococcoidia bacterium]